jgi:hypothetical protein
MKRLYGLGGDPEGDMQASAFNASASMSRADSTASLRNLDNQAEVRHPPVPTAVVDADSCTPDFDRALHELQVSMDVREEGYRPEPFSGRGQEDPLALSMSAESMGGSGGLIAWSRNLRPEDLSPDVTLASFLRPV